MLSWLQGRLSNKRLGEVLKPNHWANNEWQEAGLLWLRSAGFCFHGVLRKAEFPHWNVIFSRGTCLVWIQHSRYSVWQFALTLVPISMCFQHSRLQLLRDYLALFCIFRSMKWVWRIATFPAVRAEGVCSRQFLAQFCPLLVVIVIKWDLDPSTQQQL